MRRIVVIGGGFSGVTAAVHLAARAGEPLELRVVEPRPVAGPGLAHGSPHPDHRLNGPAGMHSIHPDAPQHFPAWLEASGALAADPGAVADGGAVFARRSDFGRYMADEFARHARANPSGSRIDHVRDAAVGLRGTAGGITVELAGGGTLEADRIVLALGWSAPGVPAPLRGLAGERGWIGDPWAAGAIEAVPRDARVLLVGTGLTACDVWVALAAQGHRGPVVALSRRGLRPAPQNPFRAVPASIWTLLREPEPAFLARHGRPATVRDALRALRRDLAAIDPSSTSWHAPFDELRDAVPHFWPGWPGAERARFARHLKGWYDAFRFRNPPQVARAVDAALADGRLRTVAGRLRGARRADGAIVVEWAARGTGEPCALQVDAVVNCTGPQPRPGAAGSPLWTRLLADGRVREDPSGLGIEVDADCRVRDARGRADGRLFALGPPTAGALGETTGVPFVARQAIDALPAILGAARR